MISGLKTKRGSDAVVEKIIATQEKKKRCDVFLAVLKNSANVDIMIINRNNMSPLTPDML